ncbi:MAG TPA: hypothetical protein VM618_13330, partial [Acidimicrobiia bacterium]|nr:hypothetical protein [Acidimicrobiia bacterium]
MIRRRVTTLLSALIIGAAAAGPALAETSNATRPTLPPVGNDTPLGDDRQVEGDGGVVPGVGTATAKITGVRLWAPDLDVRVLDADMLSTLDHVRAGMTDDLSRGYFAAASVNLGDDAAGRVASELGLPMSVPHPAYQAESRGGEHLEQFHQFPVLLPATDTPIGSVNWQEMADGPSDLLNWLCAKAHPDCDVGSGGPLGGTNALGLAQGSILEGVLEPGRVHSRMTAAGASSSANSSLRELVMMSGLSTLYDAGLGDLSADVGEDSTLGFTKGLKIESVEAIRLSALLDLMGLSPDQIPDPVLAGMLDSLGVSPASLLAGAKSIPTVADLYNGLYATIDDVSAAITAGATCALLDDGRLEAWADEAAQYGVSAPDCLGLASLQTFLDALEQVGEDVVDAIHGAVQD